MARKNAGRLLPLADKQGPLKRDEVICPICWSVLMEPVSLPCNHHLCLHCFKKHVEETSLQCPCCRMRLSVWSRRAFRENNLVDAKLWDRIQKEFPKLVQTRILGADSQDLLPEDLISIDDINGIGSEQHAVPVEHDESSPKRFVRDGDFSSAAGDIRRELESTLNKHREDIENQHRIQESASVDLIRQLQEQGELSTPVDTSVAELDLELAKKLEEDEKHERLAEITARRKLFTDPGSSARKVSSVGTKLISEWTHSQSNNFTPSNNASSTTIECNGVTTPTSSGKRPSLSSLSSRSIKKTKKARTSGLNKNTLSQKISSQGSQKSQNSILSYLSQSQSSLLDNSQSSESRIPSPKPSTSAAWIGNINMCCKGSKYSPDLLPSAFSPTKAFQSNMTNRVIPGGLVYKSIPNIINRFLKFSQEVDVPLDKPSDDPCERDMSTPDSIDLEVNSHFRPIKSAPKTPPKKLSNGTFLSEHLIVKTTPIKLLPVHAGFEEAVICSSNTSLKITCGKPHKITSEDGKRISDDSGRASASSLGSNSVVEISSDSDSGFAANKTVTTSKIDESTSNSRHINVVTEADSKDIAPKITAEVEGQSVSCGSPAHSGILEIGYLSPSSASDLNGGTNKAVAVDLDLLLLREEDDGSPTPSQDSSVMDFAAMDAQAAEFERIRLKMLQEVEDRKFALKLQRDMNQGIQPDKKYGLRSWLKKSSESDQ